MQSWLFDGFYIPLLLRAEPPIVEGLLSDIESENMSFLRPDPVLLSR